MYGGAWLERGDAEVAVGVIAEDGGGGCGDWNAIIGKACGDNGTWHGGPTKLPW